MARARSIKPSLFDNEILGTADPLYTILFEGLWCHADREGRLEDRPLRIKAQIFLYREGIKPDDLLNWLEENRFIYRRMLEIEDRHEPIDAVTLGNILEKNNELDKIGGVKTLADIINTVSTSFGILSHAKIIKELSEERHGES